MGNVAYKSLAVVRWGRTLEQRKKEREGEREINRFKERGIKSLFKWNGRTEKRKK